MAEYLKITMRLSKKKAGAKLQITNKFQITNYKKNAIRSWCLKCF